MNLFLEDKKKKGETSVQRHLCIFFLVFLDNYQTKRRVVASFTSYIILFKLLNWRHMRLQKKNCDNEDNQDTWSNDGLKKDDRILQVVPTWPGNACFFFVSVLLSTTIFSFLFSLILVKSIVHPKIQWRNPLTSFIFKFGLWSFD